MRVFFLAVCLGSRCQSICLAISDSILSLVVQTTLTHSGPEIILDKLKLAEARFCGWSCKEHHQTDTEAVNYTL